MTSTSPIIPSHELVQEWGHDANLSGVPYNDETGHWAYEQHIATRAAQWGADQELEACEKWVETYDYDEVGRQLAELLRAARRTKPPSLKEQALEGLTRLLSTGEFFSNQIKDLDTIRRALEALND
jgi:hypothetical protein